MAMDRCTFEVLIPSRFITFTFPDTILRQSALLRIAVLDSPLLPPTRPPLVAAMMVPDGRETDWIFSTESGHRQLLLNEPDISRLIVVGKVPLSDFAVAFNRRIPIDTEHPRVRLEEQLKPLLVALSPKSSLLENRVPHIPFLVYEDNLICGVLVEQCVGPCVGEMLIEDVEIDGVGFVGREFRRRLRFKRMPNLVQTEMRIVPKDPSAGVEDGEFELDTGVLVHSYLALMVASLSMVGTYIDERIQSIVKPRALCIGVGGGALLGFLQTQLGFDVVGVEVDEVVLRIARRYFGLENAEPIQIIVGDGIDFLANIAKQPVWEFHSSNAPYRENDRNMDEIDGLGTKYDVIMVDLDSGDAGSGTSAPPLEFVKRSVLLAARRALSKLGILVINVIPQSRSCYENLIHEFRVVFQDLYEIVVENEENHVLVAAASSIDISTPESENSFLSRLKQSIPNKYMNLIRKV